MVMHHTIEEADEDRMDTEPETEENTGEEDETTRRKLKFVKEVKSLIQYWPIFVKLLELSITIVCIGLIVDPLKRTMVGSSYLHHFSMIFTTFAGYCVIISILLLGRLFGDRLSYKTNAIFSLIGAGLFVTTGILILSDRTLVSRHHIFYPHEYLIEMMTVSASFAIINSVVFLLDAIMILRTQNDL